MTQKTVAKSVDEGAYHHGALRSALLKAAEGLLRESGPSAFTLRECARRAGVSHGAPAHHFGDIGGLLTALASVGFERQALMMSRAKKKGRGSLGRLRAIGLAYIEFARTNTALFRLMFSERLHLADPDLIAAKRLSFVQLSDVLDELMPEPRLSAGARATRQVLAYSTVYGFVTLLLDGGLGAPSNQVAQSFAPGRRAKTVDPMLAARHMLELLAPVFAGEAS